LVNYATKDVELHIQFWKDLLEENQFFINITHCPNICNELESWRRDERTGMPVKEWDHAIDSVRYCLANLRRLDQKGGFYRDGTTAYSEGDSSPGVASGESRYVP